MDAQPQSPDLTDLLDMSKEELIRSWVEMGRSSPPPATLSRDLLLRGLAYELQARTSGKLTRREVADLRSFGDRQKGRVCPPIKAGSRLLRLWQGRTHEVVVLEEGFLWEGEEYETLSVIARAITGTRWSGPRFFGLKA
jgi:hypothetical protein